MVLVGSLQLMNKDAGHLVRRTDISGMGVFSAFQFGKSISNNPVTYLNLILSNFSEINLTLLHIKCMHWCNKYIIFSDKQTLARVLNFIRIKYFTLTADFTILRTAAPLV